MIKILFYIYNQEPIYQHKNQINIFNNFVNKIK